MGIFKIIRNTNDGLNYMKNALDYITYGHTGCDKRYSLNTDLNYAYEQFYAVKKYYYKTSGNPVFHFVVVYNSRSTWGDDIREAEFMSRSIASYFSDRFQLVWCIHRKPYSKKYGSCASFYHAHFVMNSVSYIDGKMFSGNRTELYAFLEHIKKVTGDKFWDVKFDSDKQKSFKSDYDVMLV